MSATQKSPFANIFQIIFLGTLFSGLLNTLILMFVPLLLGAPVPETDPLVIMICATFGFYFGFPVWAIFGFFSASGLFSKAWKSLLNLILFGILIGFVAGLTYWGSNGFDPDQTFMVGFIAIFNGILAAILFWLWQKPKIQERNLSTGESLPES